MPHKVHGREIYELITPLRQSGTGGVGVGFPSDRSVGCQLQRATDRHGVGADGSMAIGNDRVPIR